MQDGLLTNNNASIVGRVVSDLTFSHEVYGEGFLGFYVDVARLSETSDILPVTVSERLLDAKSLPIGMLIQILGQIRSYNNYHSGDRKNKLIITIFARELEMLDDDANLNPNCIFLDGYVCKAPIYRTTPFGREITDILIAVNRSYNKSDYIPCIAWGRNAKFAGRLNVGDNIRVWGRLQSRNYQKRYESGIVDEKTAYEVSISKIEYAEKFEAGDLERN